MDHTMDEFTIWCTEEQTKLALELGAPIILAPEWVWLVPSGNQRYITVVSDKDDRYMVKVPTAEQMIGWLEEQGLHIATEWSWLGQITMWVWNISDKNHICTTKASSRKEAILAAIDKALEYLTTKI